MFQGKVKTEWLTKGALSPTATKKNKPIFAKVFFMQMSIFFTLV
jgi:hypothetical protein